jgi:outer membrane murein-binding lipoprotein Lpp
MKYISLICIVLLSGCASAEQMDYLTSKVEYLDHKIDLIECHIANEEAFKRAQKEKEAIDAIVKMKMMAINVIRVQADACHYSNMILGCHTGDKQLHCNEDCDAPLRSLMLKSMK